MLTFAIGDIHGCLDLLVDLLARIDREAAGRPYRLICLGDYIDRGPDSAGVVAALRGRQAGAEPGRVIYLKGNHEDMLLRALRRPDAVEHWLRNGGRETLESFGVRRAEDVPSDILEWVGRCPTAYEDERRCFVHAGLNPAYDRASQRDVDRLWIRDEFLAVDHDFGRYVVHGHTPLREGRPDVRRHRVNLDTGAVYGGRLTAAIFLDDADGPAAFLHSP